MLSWAGMKDAIHPLRTAVHMTSHKSKVMGQTTAVSPAENVNQIHNYNRHRSQFKLFSVLKQYGIRLILYLTEYIYWTPKFMLLLIQKKWHYNLMCSNWNQLCCFADYPRLLRARCFICLKSFSYALPSERVLDLCFLTCCDGEVWHCISILKTHIRLPELQLPLFSPKDIMCTNRCVTLHFRYTYTYILTGELKELVLPLTDLIFHLSTIWAPSPFLYHTTGIFDHYNASTVPQLFSSFSLRWNRLWETERSHSTAPGARMVPTIQERNFFLAEPLLCVPAPVTLHSPYFNVFISTMSQVSIKELIKK